MSEFGAFSSTSRRFVTPISLRVASAEKLSTVATCAFQPNRPTRSGPVGSSSGCTQCTRPEMPSSLASSGSSLAAIAASGIASTMPNARLELVTRVAVKFAVAGTCSLQNSLVANDCSRLCVSPGTRLNDPLSVMPKCVTLIEPQPPTGFEWHDWQLDLLKIGPMPAAGEIGVA